MGTSAKTILAMALLCAVGVGLAHAWLIDWNQTAVVYHLADPAGDVSGASPTEDIFGLYYTREFDDHYFRMDVVGTPVAGDSGPYYMIYIDHDFDMDTGASYGELGDLDTSTSIFVSTNFDGDGGPFGIDALLEMDFSSSGATDVFYRAYESNAGGSDLNFNSFTLTNAGTGGDYLITPTNEILVDIGATYTNYTTNYFVSLEWSLPLTTLSNSPQMDLYAEVLSYPSGDTTYDHAGPLHTPEPGALGMVGVLALVGAGFALRRRKA